MPGIIIISCRPSEQAITKRTQWFLYVHCKAMWTQKTCSQNMDKKKSSNRIVERLLAWLVALRTEQPHSGYDACAGDKEHVSLLTNNLLSNLFFTILPSTSITYLGSLTKIIAWKKQSPKIIFLQSMPSEWSSKNLGEIAARAPLMLDRSPLGGSFVTWNGCEAESFYFFSYRKSNLTNFFPQHERKYKIIHFAGSSKN